MDSPKPQNEKLSRSSLSHAAIPVNKFDPRQHKNTVSQQVLGQKEGSIILGSSTQKVEIKGQAASNNNNEAQQLANRHIRSH